MLNTSQIESVFRFFIACCAVALVSYLPRLRYYISGLKKPARFVNRTKNRLAIIVPARNEEGICSLLDSIQAQTYDASYFDTYVVVADESDSSIEKCKAYRNTYSCVVSGQKCKGDALDGILSRLCRDTTKHYAGYIIVDADNILDEHFVEEMNNALLSGRQIILGKRCVKNYLFGKKCRSLVVNCSALIYTFIDKMGNCFRSEKLMSCTLCGTGIMVRSDVIKKLGGWPFRTMTEDLELTISALLHGWTSLYYERAVTYTEEALTLKEADVRRSRWVTGYAQISLKYRALVERKFFCFVRRLFNLRRTLTPEQKGNMLGCFDHLYAFVPLFLYFGASVVISDIFIISAVYDFFFLHTVNILCISKILYIFALLYAVLVAYTAIALYLDRPVLPLSWWEVIAVLFVNPLFISEYAGFFVTAFFNLCVKKQTSTEWVPVERLESVGELLNGGN